MLSQTITSAVKLVFSTLGVDHYECVYEKILIKGIYIFDVTNDNNDLITSFLYNPRKRRKVWVVSNGDEYNSLIIKGHTIIKIVTLLEPNVILQFDAQGPNPEATQELVAI